MVSSAVVERLSSLVVVGSVGEGELQPVGFGQQDAHFLVAPVHRGKVLQEEHQALLGEATQVQTAVRSWEDEPDRRRSTDGDSTTAQSAASGLSENADRRRSVRAPPRHSCVLAGDRHLISSVKVVEKQQREQTREEIKELEEANGKSGERIKCQVQFSGATASRLIPGRNITR